MWAGDTAVYAQRKHQVEEDDIHDSPSAHDDAWSTTGVVFTRNDYLPSTPGECIIFRPDGTPNPYGIRTSRHRWCLETASLFHGQLEGPSYNRTDGLKTLAIADISRNAQASAGRVGLGSGLGIGGLSQSGWLLLC